MEKYKKIIRNRRIRLLILRMLFWVPNKLMLKIQYRIKLGRRLNFKNPKLYSEKIQLYKIQYKNPLIKKLTDKYEVRTWVKEQGYENLLVKSYGVYDDFDKINFSNLPNKFVIKTTNGGGGQEVFLVDDKTKTDLNKIRKQIKRLPRKSWARDGGREWGYGGIKKRIIIEEYIEVKKNTTLTDYKFFCFDGKVEYFYVIEDRVLNSDKKGTMTIYDKKMNKTPYYRKGGFSPSSKKTILPDNIETMIEIAERLSKEFPHVRVDLYNVDEVIYFGEMTFYNASGYVIFNDNELDYLMGKKFNFTNKKYRKKGKN